MIFKVNIDGSGFATIYSFLGTDKNGFNRDGANPLAGLTLSGGTLYGTTYLGGYFGYGTMFAVSTNGTGFSVLHTFIGGNDGAEIVAGLKLSNNTLFGTSQYGGNSYRGTVFSLFLGLFVEYSINPTNGTVPLTVQFTSPAVDSNDNIITNWNWSFGDASSSTLQNPSHVFTSAGIFQPTLIATNNLGLTVFGHGPLVMVVDPAHFILSAPQIAVGKTNFTFQLSGPSGSNYVLQVSTNLLNWNPVSTSTIPVSGSINLTNAISGYNNRFYRVHL